MKSSRNLRRARLCLRLSWLASAAADRAFGADVVTPSDADKEKVMSEAPPAHVSTPTATGARPRSWPTRSPIGNRTSRRGSLSRRIVSRQFLAGRAARRG